MPGALSLTIGTETVSIPLKLTNTKLRALVRRYAVERGIDVTGMTEQEIGQAILQQLAKIVRDSSVDRQRRELVNAQMAAIEVTLAADNDLMDVPPTP